MLTAHTVAQVRDAEERVMERIGPEALMQRAARGLAHSLDGIETGDRVLMLIGPGNNGGDALYAATHLLHRGVSVDLCPVTAKVHNAGWDAAVSAGAQVVEAPGNQPLVVDAMFGIGTRPGLRQRAEELAAAIRHADVVAVDVPSGIDVDNGTVPGAAVAATHTVTFGAVKPGLLISPAADWAGTDLPELIDIGLSDELGAADFEAIEPSDGQLLARYLADSVTGARTHKYTRGVVGVAAGSSQYAGAAHLTVAGAQAGPAGMVRFLGDSQISRRVVDQAPEVVAGRGRVQAWVAGPGGGHDSADMLHSVLDDGVPVVIDADALAVVPQRLGVPAVLTPHAGELATMLNVSREQVEADPLKFGHAAADRWDATVLLKGARTCVFTPGKAVRVNTSGTPWLGTAGAGDVLAGLIGSMLAAGLSPHNAASISAFLHGAAAVHANPGGPVTASQVAEVIPAVSSKFLGGGLEGVRWW